MLSRAGLLLVGFIAANAILASFVLVLARGHNGSDAEAISPVPVAPDPVQSNETALIAGGVIVASLDGYYASYTASGDLLSRKLVDRGTVMTFGNTWLPSRSCDDAGQNCQLAFMPVGTDGYVNPAISARYFDLDADFIKGIWDWDGSAFAAQDAAGGLYVVRPTDSSARRVASAVTAFAWSADNDLVFVTNGDLAKSTADGALVSLANGVGETGLLLPSPSGYQFAFTKDGQLGWELFSYDIRAHDTQEGRLIRFGRIGSPNDRNTPDPANPGFALAWSPDERYVALSPVDAPFVLYVFEVEGGAATLVTQHYFEEGYAGELRWSPAGDMLAVSTYSPDRRRHEVYLLPTDALDEAPVHLLDGCHIIWSPDGRYVAVKREPTIVPGMAVIDVATGDYWQVSDRKGIAPMAWQADEDAAFAAALTPPRNTAAVLGK